MAGIPFDVKIGTTAQLAAIPKKRGIARANLDEQSFSIDNPGGTDFSVKAGGREAYISPAEPMNAAEGAIWYQTTREDAVPINTLPVGTKIKDKTWQYLGEPIEWVIAAQNHHAKDSDYPEGATTLWSANILAFYAYDAMEPNNPIADRAASGNSRYSLSNIRQWLNSADKYWYRATHEHDVPPSTASSVTSTPYTGKAGLMSYLSEGFRALLMPTKIKSYLNPIDDATYLGEPEAMSDNFFLPSLYETLSDDPKYGYKWAVVADTSTLLRKPTPGAVSDSRKTVNANTNYSYYLRDSDNEGEGRAKVVTSAGVNSRGVANGGSNGTVGITVACNINGNALVYLDGGEYVIDTNYVQQSVKSGGKWIKASMGVDTLRGISATERATENALIGVSSLLKYAVMPNFRKTLLRLPIMNLENYYSSITTADMKSGTPENIDNLPYTWVYDRMDALMASHPDYINKWQIGAAPDGSGGTLPIHAYRIKRPAMRADYYYTTQTFIEQEFPKVLSVSGVHGGTERNAPVSLMLLIEDIFARGWDDPFLNTLRDNVEFVVVPLLSPGSWIRKLRTNYNGVNINRNFPYKWELTAIGSDYSGPSAASESETQALISLISSEDDGRLIAGIDGHNFVYNAGQSTYCLYAVRNMMIARMPGLMAELTMALVKRLPTISDAERAIVGTGSSSSTSGTCSKYMELHMHACTLEHCTEIGYTGVAEPSGSNAVLKSNMEYWGNLIRHMLKACGDEYRATNPTGRALR